MLIPTNNLLVSANDFPPKTNNGQTKYTNACPSLTFGGKSFADTNKSFVGISKTLHHGGGIIIIFLYIYFNNYL